MEAGTKALQSCQKETQFPLLNFIGVDILSSTSRSFYMEQMTPQIKLSVQVPCKKKKKGKKTKQNKNKKKQQQQQRNLGILILA